MSLKWKALFILFDDLKTMFSLTFFDKIKKYPLTFLTWRDVFLIFPVEKKENVTSFLIFWARLDQK